MNFRKYLTKTKIIIGSILLLIILVVGLSIYRSQNAPEDVLTDTVKKSDIQQNVLATGQVSSTTDLNLTFKSSGLVDRVSVRVGQKVTEGDILANLTQKDQSATLTQARAAVAQAQANYNKIIAGANTPEVNLARASVQSAQIALDNTKLAYNATAFQQETLVKNAKLTLYNSGLQAQRSRIVSDEVTATLSGSYQGDIEGEYRFEAELYGTGFKVRYRGIENGLGNLDIKRGIPMPLGTKGLYVTFSIAGSFGGNPEWVVKIPNTESASYLSTQNAYNAAVQSRDSALVLAQSNVSTAESNLVQAQLRLEQTLAAARPEDVAIARAQIQAAQGQLQAASAMFDSTVIRAPSSGTITAVNIKNGEQASPAQTAIVLQDVDNLHIEANISEANIAQVKLDQEVNLTFDALGADREFIGKVKLIDPASTVVSGVVNYKITVALEKFEEVKPGMTANLSILTDSKQQVLNIPQRAVINRDGKRFVRVVTDSEKKTYQEQGIRTGIDADGGVVEILSGVNEGQEIVTFVNKK